MSDTVPCRGMRCHEAPILRSVNKNVLADHTYRTITGADDDEIKRNGARLSHSGPGFDSRSGQVFWVRFFRGFSSPVRQMSGRFRPQSPRISFGHHHHQSSFITGANDLKFWSALKPQMYIRKTKWMKWVWRNGGMKFVIGENGRNPEKKPTQTPFRPPRKPHGVTETWTRDPSCGRRATNRLLYGIAINLINLPERCQEY